jgi:hypothetical protein
MGLCAVGHLDLMEGSDALVVGGVEKDDPANTAQVRAGLVAGSSDVTTRRNSPLAILCGIPLSSQSWSSISGETTSMPRRLTIRTLTLDDIRAEVRAATTVGLDATRIADFLALVDWSGPDDANPAVISMLGTIDNWESQYAEGDIPAEKYTELLQSLLPSRV